jgi:hypothetical protein
LRSVAVALLFANIDSALPSGFALARIGVMSRSKFLGRPLHDATGQSIDELDLSRSRAFPFNFVFGFVPFGEFEFDRLFESETPKCLVTDIYCMKIHISRAFMSDKAKAAVGINTFDRAVEHKIQFDG